MPQQLLEQFLNNGSANLEFQCKSTQMVEKNLSRNIMAELCELLNVQHSKTSPYYPQCNAQVEVFHKTVKNIWPRMLMKPH
jgi:hypothetical protein